MNSGGDNNACAIVLAGVHRWDEAAIDRALPRPMLPVVASPLIGYVLHWLRSGGIDTVTICPNGSSRPLRNCIGDGSSYGLSAHYYEDWTPRGPAGSVHDAGYRTTADHFVIAEAAIIPQLDLTDLLRSHARSEAAITVVAQREWPLSESGSPRVSPCGIYVFARRVLSEIPATGYQDIKEMLIPRLHRTGQRIDAYVCESVCPRVSDSQSYLAVNEWMLEEMARRSSMLGGYTQRGQVWMHVSARVDLRSRVLGPVVFGPDVEVERGALIVGPTTVGRGTRVGRSATVSRSVVWEGVVIGAGAVVDRAILTSHAEIGAGERVYGCVCTTKQRARGTYAAAPATAPASAPRNSRRAGCDAGLVGAQAGGRVEEQAAGEGERP